MKDDDVLESQLRGFVIINFTIHCLVLSEFDWKRAITFIWRKIILYLYKICYNHLKIL